MPDFIDIPIETDPNALAGAAFDVMTDFYADWSPDDANLDTWMITAIATMAAIVRDLASSVPRAIFRDYGAYVIGLPPIDGSPASTTTTWTMIDNLGHTIPAGTNVGIRNADGELIPFTVSSTVVVPALSTVTSAGEVPITGADDDASGEALGGAGESVELLDSLAYVAGITMTAATSGGVDPELDDDYLNRLATELTLMAPRPILPSDFSDMARNIAGIARALVIDGYNPGDTTYNNERMIAIAAVDALGIPISGPLKATLDAYLQSRREINFVVNVIDPTVTPVDFQYTAVAFEGYLPAEVEATIDAALTSAMSPSRFGLRPNLDDHAWVFTDKVKLNDMIVIAGSQEGCDDITDLKMRIGADPFAAADVTLPGVAPLTNIGTIAGTVT